MSWRILNRRTRFDIIRGILLVGLASALAVYVTARDPGTDPLGNPLDQSKVYLRTVEMVGGTANVVASQITDGFNALWHGKALAFTLAFLTLVLAYGFYFVTEDLPRE
jgi:hypothetical protein